MNLGERLVEFFREGGVAGLAPARFLEEYSVRVNVGRRDAERTILVAEGDPARFLAALAVGLAAGSRMLLASPRWRANEWRQVDQIVSAEIIFGDTPLIPRSWEASGETLPKGPCLAIPTGGTSGKVRFAVHDDATLEAAAQGFHQWQQEESLVCWSGLPFHHVSGLMPLVRAVLGNGKFVWTQGIEQRRQVVSGKPNVLSLVPTQIARALDEPEAVSWLSGFSTILVGGAGMPAGIRNAARSAALPLSPSYGMTETAAAVCAVRPAEFLSGDDSSGSALPHGKVTVADAKHGRPGRLFVESKSLFRGYWGEDKICDPLWPTDDLGYLDEAGRLHVSGRLRPIINSGGEKIDPAEVERALLDSGIAKEAHVVGTPDSEWGERVTAIYVPGSVDDRECLKEILASHKIPKHWISVPSLPRLRRDSLKLQNLSE